ncbi:MAG: hypothetical protein JHC93_00525, partial [Parachlamydiales bacterium]|nr:hypothetical protein [Parachlamydiales bacterium]
MSTSVPALSTRGGPKFYNEKIQLAKPILISLFKQGINALYEVDTTGRVNAIKKFDAKINVTSLVNKQIKIANSPLDLNFIVRSIKNILTFQHAKKFDISINDIATFAKENLLGRNNCLILGMWSLKKKLSPVPQDDTLAGANRSIVRLLETNISINKTEHKYAKVSFADATDIISIYKSIVAVKQNILSLDTDGCQNQTLSQFYYDNEWLLDLTYPSEHQILYINSLTEILDILVKYEIVLCDLQRVETCIGYLEYFLENKIDKNTLEKLVKSIFENLNDFDLLILLFDKIYAKKT